MKKIDLAEAVLEAGFTPSIRHKDDLFELLGRNEAPLVRAVERALIRAERVFLPAAIQHAVSSEPRLKARLVRLVGKIGRGEPQTMPFLRAVLSDTDPKARRNAIVALGYESGSESESLLLDAWGREDRIEHRRSIAASLSKVGGARALEHLRQVTTTDDELRRIVDRAILILERSLGRSLPSRINGGESAPVPLPILLHCREGLEDLVAADFSTWNARPEGGGRVSAKAVGKLDAIFSSRLSTHASFPLVPVPINRGTDLGRAVVSALTSPRAKMIFETWTTGPIRYRIAWGKGGHLRAVVWRSAKEVAQINPNLVNDPTRSTWEAIVNEEAGRVLVELVPRALNDPRFSYRVSDVPAASHPTLAAALVRVAGVREDDVVWDPFMGSGLELIERGLAGPRRALYGSDLDPRALEAARANAERAGVLLHLERRDAMDRAPEGVNVIITNPPMGRRVNRSGHLSALFDRALEHFAKALPPQGRLVWISPLPERTEAQATHVGLRPVYVQNVDMGGFWAQLQAFEKCR